MTREEAINEWIIPAIKNTWNEKKCKEIIKALEQEPCEDCISRQAAIDLADELKDDLPDDDRLSDMVMSHNEGILDYQTKLSLLPPVTPAEDDPDTNVGEYINREDALMCLTGEWTELTDEVIHRFIKRIKNLPLMVLPKPTECEDCISRQAVLEIIEREEFKGDAISEIEKLPPVTPAEKVGWWIYGEDNLGGTGRDGWYCNQCGHFEFWDYSMDMKSAKLNLPNFCPNCGKKMEVEE